MGQIKKAIECFEQAIRLRPDYVKARINLARALSQLGKAEEALVPLEEAIDLEPDDAEAHIYSWRRLFDNWARQNLP